MQLDAASFVRMRKMLRHRLLNFVSGVKSANVLLSNQLDDRLRPQEREYFTLIIKECDLLAHMTERLESLFSTIPEPDPAPVADLLESFLAEMHASHPMAEIAIEQDSAVAPRNVCGVAFKTALKEVVSNAYDFSRKPISIAVADSGEACTVRIVDHGNPLSEEALKMAFEPFYSTRPRHVGVGLSIARRLVEDRGGSMAISSKDGPNCVTIMLPYIDRA